jgi:hypothetical protein
MAFAKLETIGLMHSTHPFLVLAFIKVCMIPTSSCKLAASYLYMLTTTYLIFGKSDTILSTVIANLKKDFVLTSKDSIGAYLGINICYTNSGLVELTQPGLINKIIQDFVLQDQSTEHSTPATMILHADVNGPPREHSWNYHSNIRMLN